MRMMVMIMNPFLMMMIVCNEDKSGEEGESDDDYDGGECTANHIDVA